MDEMRLKMKIISLNDLRVIYDETEKLLNYYAQEKRRCQDSARMYKKRNMPEIIVEKITECAFWMDHYLEVTRLYSDALFTEIHERLEAGQA